ncbi:MAG: hypothetical protein FJZ16_09435, partial [Candidatus Omnitrophica bacterium]|nr:hypothetical protein [Candidatus Omnitrophota bacterium]
RADLKESGLSRFIRADAATALGAIDKTIALTAAPDLIKALDDDDEVCKAAATTLGKLGCQEAIPKLVVMLRKGGNDIREAAVNALVNIGKTAIPALANELVGPHYIARQASVTTLERMNAYTPELKLKKLMTDLSDSNRDIRMVAAYELGSMESAMIKSVTLSLIKLLEKETDKAVRQDLTRALNKLKPEDSTTEIIEALDKLLQANAEDIRNSAFEILTKINALTLKRKIIKCVADLKDPNYLTRQSALAAIGLIGPAAAEYKDVIPTLLLCLQDRVSDIRQSAADTLTRISCPAAVPSLVNCLGDEYTAVRQPVMDALVKVGKPAVPALEGILGDKASSVRRAAEEILTRLHEFTPPRRIRKYNADLKYGDTETRRVTAVSIGDIATEANEETISALVSALIDKDEVCQVAVETLVKIGERAVPALINALGYKTGAPSDRVIMCGKASNVLFRIGQPAVPHLVTALGNRNSDVRIYSIKILTQLVDAAKIVELVRTIQKQISEHRAEVDYIEEWVVSLLTLAKNVAVPTASQLAKGILLDLDKDIIISLVLRDDSPIALELIQFLSKEQYKDKLEVLNNIALKGKGEIANTALNTLLSQESTLPSPATISNIINLDTEALAKISKGDMEDINSIQYRFAVHPTKTNLIRLLQSEEFPSQHKAYLLMSMVKDIDSKADKGEILGILLDSKSALFKLISDSPDEKLLSVVMSIANIIELQIPIDI